MIKTYLKAIFIIIFYNEQSGLRCCSNICWSTACTKSFADLKRILKELIRLSVVCITCFAISTHLFFVCVNHAYAHYHYCAIPSFFAPFRIESIKWWGRFFPISLHLHSKLSAAIFFMAIYSFYTWCVSVWRRNYYLFN